MVVDALLSDRVTETVIDGRALIDTEQVVRVAVEDRIYTALCHTYMREVVSKLPPWTVLHTTLRAVHRKIPIRTCGHTSASGRVCEGHVRTMVDTFASDVVGVEIGVGGTDLHAEIGGIVGVVVGLGWTGRDACPS